MEILILEALTNRSIFSERTLWRFPVTSKYLSKFLLICSTVILSSCSLEVSLSSLDNGLPDLNLKNERTETDFVVGETVTTASGAVILGSFGEVSSKTKLGNGAIIEGAFYE